MRWLLIMLSFCLAAQATEELPLERLLLRTGEVRTGAFALQGGGIFHHTDYGGELLHWREISLKGLPAAALNRIRAQLRKRLRYAQHLYEHERAHLADKHFNIVYQARHFLTDATTGSPAWAHIDKKRRGLVPRGDDWVDLVAWQRRQGLVWYRKKWVEREVALRDYRYRQAIASAREAESPRDGIDRLEELIEARPNSRYNGRLQAVIADLEEKAAARDERLARRQAVAEARERRRERMYAHTRDDPFEERYGGFHYGHRTTIRREPVAPVIIKRDGKTIIQWPGAVRGHHYQEREQRRRHAPLHFNLHFD